MTNEEKIKAMKTWELAEFIYRVSNGCQEITTCKENCNECESTDEFCTSCIAEWLIQEADECDS